MTVRELRNALGMSQAMLARLCGVSLGAVVKWDSDVGKPSGERAEIIQFMISNVDALRVHDGRLLYVGELPKDVALPHGIVGIGAV